MTYSREETTLSCGHVREPFTDERLPCAEPGCDGGIFSSDARYIVLPAEKGDYEVVWERREFLGGDRKGDWYWLATEGRTVKK